MSDSAGITSAIREAAAQWRMRLDAGMDGAQDAAFIAWLDADERHAIAFGEIQETFTALLQLEQVRPAGAPDPDLFARPSAERVRSGRKPWLSWGVAAAALIAAGLWLGTVLERRGPAMTHAASRPEPRRMDLPDGSVVELNDRSRVDVQFSAAERRVRLAQGEAYFTVVKDPARPFIVEAHGVAVRAIGTAFCVNLQAENVAVLVTEGKVTVSTAPVVPAAHPDVAARSEAPLFLEGGHRVAIRLPVAGAIAEEPIVESVSLSGIEQALAWRSRLLEFVDVPLTDVVAEFNRYNRHQLIIADESLAQQRFGGTFRPDAYATAVRLLEHDFDVVAERRENETVLRRRR